jgi:hypothetical protein
VTPTGANSGKWRVLYGKVESGLMLDLELRGGSPYLCRLRTDRLTLVNMFDYVPTHAGLWGPRNPVASVTAWSDRNHYTIVVVGGRMR